MSRRPKYFELDAENCQFEYSSVEGYSLTFREEGGDQATIFFDPEKYNLFLRLLQVKVDA